MKKLIFAALAVLIVVGVTVASTAHYQNYKTKQKNVAVQQQQQEASKQAQQQKQNEDIVQSLTRRIDQLTVECEKGRKIYETYVSAAVKKSLPSPTCTAR